MTVIKDSTKNSRPNNLNSANNQRGSIFGFTFLIIIIIAMIFLTLYILRLDRVITQKFEGKHWDIPAKVYSKPLELYQGANVDVKTIDTWLGLLNYRPNSKYNRTGSFHKSNNTYIIHTRGFQYGTNDVEPEQVIQISIRNNRIKSIKSTQSNDTGIIRLEPMSIGGIYPDNNEDRIILQLKDMPKPIINALVSTEDRGFYEHKGVSIKGITRAIINNIAGKSTQGGSTITQQLIKNFYLNSERTLSRKANEAIMAILLEMHYSKDQILQTYMNEINLGQSGKRSINGFGLASQFYFNRPLNELRIDQQALLVGLAKGPSYYNPRRQPERAIKRRNTVLNNMLVTNKLSQSEYDEAILQPLNISKTIGGSNNRFPDFLDIVKRELNEVYNTDDLKNEGLLIISTMDPIAQIAANRAVISKLDSLRKKSTKTKTLESALVSADPATGELVAVVGSGNQFTGFNRAIDAKRQVGSVLKPVIYLTALQSGKYNVASSVDDSPITIKLSDGGKWSPKNYDGKSNGYTGLTTALAKSYNQSAVRLGMEFGIDTYIKQLHNLGIQRKIEPYPSILLGSVALTPMDVLGVYQVFASGGFRTPIHSIRSVSDSKGNVLQRAGLDTKLSVPADANYLTNYAMQQVVNKGTAKSLLSLGNNLHLAGKTGTTNDYRDAWFAGYSGNYVSVVWVGRDNNKPIGLSGSSGALPIWKSYMGQLNLAPVALAKPDNIEWLWLENNEGTLSNELCPDAIYAPVVSKNAPEKASACAMNIYEQEIIAKRDQWLYDQLYPTGEDTGNLKPSNQDSEKDNQPQPEVNPDTWYDKALQFF